MSYNIQPDAVISIYNVIFFARELSPPHRKKFQRRKTRFIGKKWSKLFDHVSLLFLPFQFFFEWSYVGGGNCSTRVAQQERISCSLTQSLLIVTSSPKPSTPTISRFSCVQVLFPLCFYLARSTIKTVFTSRTTNWIENDDEFPFFPSGGLGRGA